MLDPNLDLKTAEPIAQNRAQCISDISKLKVTNQDLSLFHINSRSLTLHFDQLHSLISNLKIPFDLTGITETRQQKDTNFLTNVNINGYNLHAQQSKNHADGAAIYIRSDINYKVRDELKHLRMILNHYE